MTLSRSPFMPPVAADALADGTDHLPATDPVPAIVAALNRAATPVLNRLSLRFFYNEAAGVYGLEKQPGRDANLAISHANLMRLAQLLETGLPDGTAHMPLGFLQTAPAEGIDYMRFSLTAAEAVRLTEHSHQAIAARLVGVASDLAQQNITATPVMLSPPATTLKRPDRFKWAAKIVLSMAGASAVCDTPGTATMTNLAVIGTSIFGAAHFGFWLGKKALKEQPLYSGRRTANRMVSFTLAAVSAFGMVHLSRTMLHDAAVARATKSAQQDAACISGERMISGLFYPPPCLPDSYINKSAPARPTVPAL